jgi:uncharacterized protein (TIGR01244 family)
MKNFIGVGIILMAFSLAFALPLNEIPNLQRATEGIYTAGQPSEEGFKQAAAFGIRTVINVLPEKQWLAGETEMVTLNNMKYRSVPVYLNDFRKQTVDQFAELLRNSDRPILIHCATGNHVGAVWFAYRVLVDKAPLVVGLKEGRRIGMRPETEDAIFNWVVMQQEQRASNN